MTTHMDTAISVAAGPVRGPLSTTQIDTTVRLSWGTDG
jgi:hypothetical protein